MDRLPVVALLGRPNVGKSTLFNRLLRRRQAIVAPVPGVTRDRLVAPVAWRGRRFLLVDTGGLDPDGPRAPVGDGPAALAAAARRQALEALREADLAVLVVDARAGLHPDDAAIAALLRRAGKPALVAANKADRAADEQAAAEFYALGLGDPVPVSAEHGRNAAELLERIVACLPPAGEGEAAERDEAVRVCVLGRPNVGKSSLINRLVGRERMIVSDVPGTTREPVDVRWEAGGRVFEVVDTAGLRRRARVADEVEYYGVVRTLRALERCEVALLVLDAAQGVVEQDKRIAGQVHERGRACVLAVNKWDLVAGVPETEAEEAVRRALPFLSYAPVLFVSARTGLNLDRLPGALARAADHHAARVPAADLERVVVRAQEVHGPPARGGRSLRIRGAVQVGVRPPTFVVSVNDPELVDKGYERYLENRLREAFDFSGTAIRLRFRKAGQRRRPEGEG